MRVREYEFELEQESLTCDIDINGALFPGLVPVSAAEQSSVLRQTAAHRHAAAVLLTSPPAARILHLHLIFCHT